MIDCRWRAGCAIVSAFLMGGCASLPLEQGRSDFQSLVQSRTGVSIEQSADSATQPTWLAEPLTRERAQQIALLRSPALQSFYARLDLAAADEFEAGRLQNPTLGFAWLLPLGAAEGGKGSASLFMSFADLLLQASRRRLAQAEYKALQESLAAQALQVMADTQRAWFACVAANQRVAVHRTIADAAQLAAELAAKYREAGNLGELELQIQRAEASQARVALHDAQLEQADARAELQRLLGLAASDAGWTVPDTLPEVPKAPQPATGAMIASVLEQRLDLSAARRHVQALQEARTATHRLRLLAGSRVGAGVDREADGAKRVGPAAEIALPVFQQGQGAVARADAELAAAQAELAALQVDAQAELSRQFARRDLAREQAVLFREALIPQREAVVARVTEQANFMLVDRFAVLMARQQEYAAYAGYVDAQLRYWNADVDLLRAMGSLRGQEESR